MFAEAGEGFVQAVGAESASVLGFLPGDEFAFLDGGGFERHPHRFADLVEQLGGDCR